MIDTIETEESVAANESFSKTEKHFEEVEANIATTRRFLSNHKEQLMACGQFSDQYGIEPKISFPTWRSVGHMRIARTFGATGWERVTSEYSCGQINWHKTVDGVLLVIEGAEQLPKQLIKEVKLPPEPASTENWEEK